MKPNNNRNPRAGFTLAELLVVIFIIILLATLLMPSLSMAVKMAYAGKSAARVMEMSTAALSYSQINSGYFPGQMHLPKASGTDFENLTGSQVFSLAVWSDATNADKGLKYTGSSWEDTGGKVPQPIHMGYQLDKHLDNNMYPEYTPSDHFPDARPILYFPSRPTNDGTVGSAFDFNDNWDSDYFITETEDGLTESELKDNFQELITNPELSTSGTNIAYKSNEYILIAPGIDRYFFEDQSGNKDDVTNFKKQ